MLKDHGKDITNKYPDYDYKSTSTQIAKATHLLRGDLSDAVEYFIKGDDPLCLVNNLHNPLKNTHKDSPQLYQFSAAYNEEVPVDFFAPHLRSITHRDTPEKTKPPPKYSVGHVKTRQMTKPR